MKNYLGTYRLFFFGWTAIILIVMLVNGTTTFADAFRGYEIMEQFADGAAFNTLNYPSAQVADYSYYAAWWSPGQWVLPYFLKYILHIGSIQIIQALLIFSALCTALYGYYRLFTRLGFTPSITFLSLLMISTNQLFYWHSIMYYGGDLFLLMIFPFFILLLLRYNESSDLTSVVLLFLGCAVGIFFKNTFILFVAAAGIFLIFSTKGSSQQKKILHIGLFGVFSIVLLYLIYHFHLLRGETPGNVIDHEGYNGLTNNFIGDLSYSLGSTVGIFSRFTFLVQKGFHGDGILGNILQLIPLILSFMYLQYLLKKSWNEFSRLILFFCLPILVFFVIFYLMDKAVSYEMRHFTPIAFLFFPGLIEWMFDRLKRPVVFSFLAVFCLFDIGLYGMSLLKLEKETTAWNDLKVGREDAELFRIIEKWDHEHTNGLVIVEDYWLPMIAIRKNHKLTVKKQKKIFFVVSGMELSNPDLCTLRDLDLQKYNAVLFIRKNNGNFSIPDWLIRQRGKLIPSRNKQFTILEIRNE